MRRTLLTLGLTLLLAAAPATAGAAESRTAAQVVEQGLALDGSVITFTGEAIGEDLRADSGHRWINVRSGGTAVGVFMTNAEAAIVERYGSYSTTGDTLVVTGVVRVACDEHAGEFDVHAKSVVRASPGKDVSHVVEWWKGAVGLIAAAVGFAEWRLLARMREREDEYGS